MFSKTALLALSFAAIAYGQQAGTQTAETHPQVSSQKCTAGGSCTTASTSVVLDSNWRWVHTTSGYTNCYTGNTWDASICSDPVTCAQSCALDGADYAGTYGITASGDSLKLQFVTGSNVGSRVYLMQDESNYQMFKLMNQEFTFDVDVSNLPCGLNGAVYFVQMDQDGGMSRFPNNKAGAKFGTGYCDSQCPRDIKFINGEANIVDWSGDSGDPNSGTGSFGTCCQEMDIWEANSVSAAFTPHPCTVTTQTRCTGADCGQDSDRYNGVCDPDGCDFNSFRMGDTSFYGKGLTVDTSQKFTIVTQFISDDGTSDGNLAEIRRFYVQNGKVIPNSNVKISGIDAVNSITEDFCDQQKSVFGDNPNFQAKGGLAQMGEAIKNGMVLALSLWDDHAAQMLWLDSDYPTDADTSAPGVARGTCPTTSGDPSSIESQSGSASVTYSNIKFGDLNSTFSATGSGSSSNPGSGSPASSSSAPAQTSQQAGTVAQWAQCGGTGYTGPTACVSPFTCHVVNPYYSQCY